MKLFRIHLAVFCMMIFGVLFERPCGMYYYVLCTFATKGRCNQLATDVIFKALMTTLEMGEGVPC